MPLDIIVGVQWGDEGKGRVVDLLAGEAEFVARYNGGDNAGHTVTVGDKIFQLHLIPSGIIHPHIVALIGNGLVVNPEILLKEISELENAGIDVSPERLRISHAAHLITPAHRAMDQAQEAWRGNAKIGTTLRGIGPAYTSKVTRHGLRFADMLDLETFRPAIRSHVREINHVLKSLYEAEPLDEDRVVSEFEDYAHRLKPYIGDVSGLLASSLARGRQVLAEGAQGTLLDLDHGTYPYVTSSNTVAPGAPLGLGLGLGYVERVVGVTKCFQTRVGAGPFPTEISGDAAVRLRGTGEHPWDEFGTTTGRPRRVGWLDGVLLRYSSRVNGLTELALTKLDILTGIDPIHICIAYRHGDEVVRELPYGPARLELFQPIYEDLPGWNKDVSGVKSWEDLPPEARAYILRIEEISSVPVRLVSVGPEREQVIEIV